MPTYLKVPFPEKDEAKALGARWDGACKKWFVPDGRDPEPFARWLDGGAAAAPAATAGGMKRVKSAPAAPAAELFAAAPAGAAEPAAGETRGMGLFEYLTMIHEVINEIGRVPQWIRAEVSEFNVKPNGHAFLQLIEHDAQRKPLAKTGGRIWSRDLPAIMARFEEGTGGKVAAGMKILFEARGEFHQQYGFSLTISDIDPSFTLGDIEAKLREIRTTLQREKVYDLNKKLPLPGEYCRVAVISPSGAAGLGDFRAEADRLDKFGLCAFSYFEATFQGDAAPASIREALRQALAEHERAPFDALVVIRGGGAKTDLAYLNDLELARDLCLCPVPVYTGIGHERDNTSLDEVAAQRFDTPSKVVKHFEETIVSNARAAQGNWEFIIATARNLVTESRRQADKYAHAITTAARAALAAAQQRTERAAAVIRRQAQVLLERAGGLAQRQRAALVQQARRLRGADRDRAAAACRGPENAGNGEPGQHPEARVRHRARRRQNRQRPGAGGRLRGAGNRIPRRETAGAAGNNVECFFPLPLGESAG